MRVTRISHSTLLNSMAPALLEVFLLMSNSYIQFHKAMHFKDYVTAASILETLSPTHAKELGANVKVVDESVWQPWLKMRMMEACYHKFVHNADKTLFLDGHLLKTEELHLVEASQDPVSGIGMSKEQAVRALPDQARWDQNLFGEALMGTRKIILELLATDYTGEIGALKHLQNPDLQENQSSDKDGLTLLIQDLCQSFPDKGADIGTEHKLRQHVSQRSFQMLMVGVRIDDCIIIAALRSMGPLPADTELIEPIAIQAENVGLAAVNIDSAK